MNSIESVTGKLKDLIQSMFVQKEKSLLPTLTVIEANSTFKFITNLLIIIY